MTLDSYRSDHLTLDSPRLELPIEQSIGSHATYSTAGARHRADLNQVSAAAFLAWLQAEQVPTAQVWPNVGALPSFWELVNGTAIRMGAQRLVIIPTEAIDGDELRVPQEWVDIPTWAADYYVLLQVNLDEDLISVLGYTTHYQLKHAGQYDADDRSYSLDRDQLIADINVLWLSQQFCPTEILQSEIAALTTLESTQSHNLLNRLGNSTVIFPRLEIPFSLWGSLLAHGGWRQRLYEQRQGCGEQWSMQQWLQTGLSQWAEQFGWNQGIMALAPIAGMRSAAPSPTVYLSRSLMIAGNAYELRIVPQGEVTDRVWRFTLTSSDPNGLIPAGFTLRLLTEDLQPFEHNTDTALTASAELTLEVMLEPAEGIVWEIDPAPEGYDREILRF
jgi:Protein of unknown function (DUF1822)